MTFSIAVSGKGGAGKTTIAALLIKILHKKTGKLILAVDADPNSNLHESLGASSPITVGEIRERLLDERENIPVEQSKAEYLEGLIETSLGEYDGFDLLTMGRPEGPGCYCYVNNILRKIIDTLSERYPIIVIDAEAGLEHFSRRTTRDIDLLLIVTDPTQRGIRTAKRTVELVKELNTKIGQIHIVANRINRSVEDRVLKDISDSGLTCIQAVPEDSMIQELDLAGKPITDLPESSPAYIAIQELADRVVLIQSKISR